MNVKSRHHLKGSEAKKVCKTIEPLVEDVSALQGSVLEIAETDQGPNLIFVNGEPFLLIFENEPFFTVRGAIELCPKDRLVVVDSGAVSYLVNGADVMAPGVVEADPKIVPGDMVVVMEERYRKPLAIGQALVPGAEMHGTGKVVRSIHHVGDNLWNMSG